MGSLKVTLVCLSICLPAIAGLRCLKCVDYFVDADNEFVRNMLKQLGIPEQPACRTPVDNTTTKLPLETCVEISGNVPSCFFLIATGSFSGGGESMDVSFTQRGCVTIGAGMKDTCEEQNPDNMAPGIGDVEGSVCYCSTDKCNGQTRLVPTLVPFFFFLLAFFSLRE